MLRLSVAAFSLAAASAHDHDVHDNPHHIHNPLELLGQPRDPLALEDGVELRVSPDQLDASGAYVTVSWSGVQEPNGADWIAAYSPSTVDISQSAPVKYSNASVTHSHTQDGSGELQVRLVNMRDDYVFVMLRNGTAYPTVAARSSPVSFANPNEPLQGHLALTGDVTEMRVSWATRDAQAPTVRWAPTADLTSVHSAAAEIATYAASDMCAPPATTIGWHDPGLLHSAVMTGLTPGAEYVYQFGDDAYGWSEQLTFTAAPAPGANETVSFFAFGDMGTAQADDMVDYGHPMEVPSLKTSEHLEQWADQTDFVFHVGDISYARGYSTHWEEFADQIAPVATKLPWMLGVGNHERDSEHGSPIRDINLYNTSDSGGECGVPTQFRYVMPAPADVPENDEMWYSFDYGPVHMVMMSSEHDFRVGTPQYNWLSDDLDAVDRSVTPWTVLGVHRPFYIDSDYGPYTPLSDSDQDVAALLRENVEPLLFAGPHSDEPRVQLVLQGHHHSYQRTCAVRNGTCLGTSQMEPGDKLRGVRHVVVGNAGQSLCTNLLADRPEYMEYVNDAEYGWSRIEASPTALNFKSYQNVDGGLLDEFNLYQ